MSVSKSQLVSQFLRAGVEVYLEIDGVECTRCLVTKQISSSPDTWGFQLTGVAANDGKSWKTVSLTIDQIYDKFKLNELIFYDIFLPKWIKIGGYIMVLWNAETNDCNWGVAKITDISIDTGYIKIQHNIINVTSSKNKKNEIKMNYSRLKISYFDDKSMLQQNNVKNINILKCLYLINRIVYIVPIKSKELRYVNYGQIQDSLKLVQNDLSKLTQLGNTVSFSNSNDDNDNDNNTIINNNNNTSVSEKHMSDEKETNNSNNTKKHLANMGFSYNIQAVYETLNEILLSKYCLLCDLNILCIMVSYLLESKISLNIACFGNVITNNDYTFVQNNDKNINENKLWKCGKAYAILIEFELNRKINSFYGLEIDIPCKNFSKKNIICYAKIHDGSYKSPFWPYDCVDFANYLSQTNTINDIQCICCDDPNKILLYVKNNEKNKVDLTKYLTLYPNNKYTIEIVITKDIKVKKWYKIEKMSKVIDSNHQFNNKFSLGIYKYIKYNAKWVPHLRMLIGTHNKNNKNDESQSKKTKNSHSKPTVN